MRVKALRKGFFGGKIRKEGKEFTIPEIEVRNDRGVDKKATAEATLMQFSDKWMVEVKSEPKNKASDEE